MLINRNDIYDKNLNFLIGSGASAGVLPTLGLQLKQSGTTDRHTLETLASQFAADDDLMCLIFSYYVEKVITPAAKFDISKMSDEQKGVLNNYVIFLEAILTLLNKQPNGRRANVFTTNYDGFIAHSAERMIQRGQHDFILNDGGTGFVKRTLQTRSFNRFVKDQGSFGRHEVSVPQINLIQPHGSVYWYKDGENIEISYSLERSTNRISAVPTSLQDKFEELLGDEDKSDADIAAEGFSVDTGARAAFWDKYEELPIVNPTKWKFHETVFEEHYYQSLRALSYELEKPNSVFIVFGFSFADEHILSLVKRSLSNPTLKVFVCCFNDQQKADLERKFKIFDNVELVRVDGDLDFDKFNGEVFNSNPEPTEEISA